MYTNLTLHKASDFRPRIHLCSFAESRCIFMVLYDLLISHFIVHFCLLSLRIFVRILCIVFYLAAIWRNNWWYRPASGLAWVTPVPNNGLQFCKFQKRACYFGCLRPCLNCMQSAHAWRKAGSNCCDGCHGHRLYWPWLRENIKLKVDSNGKTGNSSVSTTPFWIWRRFSEKRFRISTNNL